MREGSFTPSLFHSFPPSRWTIFGLAVFGLLAASLWLRASAPGRGQPAPVAARPNSMAVLPFVNISPDTSDDYLGYGVAAELTRALSRLSGIRVAARSSAFGLKEIEGDPRIIGRRLNVGTLLQGNVRRSGNRLRITARLVDVDEGFDLWSETYERTPADVFDIQDEIGRAIAGTLRIPLDSSGRLRRPAGGLAAYDAYLAGRYLLEQRTPGTAPRAIAYLTRATRIDTAFAEAQAALAQAYLRRGDVEALPPRVAVPLAREAASRALALDSTLAEAHTTLGVIQFGFERDWRRAEVEFRKAIALEPASPEAHQQYSRFLLAMGRNDEAHAEIERALRLSPAAPLLTAQLGWHYLHARRYDRAREALWRALEMDSTAWRTHFNLALVEQAAGNLAEAETRLRVPLEIAPERAEVQLAAGQLYAATGRVEQAKEILQRLRQAAEQRYVSPYFIACLQASLGMRSQAFAFLDRAARERSEFIGYLRIDPRVDSLRTDRRFARLLRQLRLP